MRLPQASIEEGLGALVAQGRVTCDSVAACAPSRSGWSRKTGGSRTAGGHVWCPVAVVSGAAPEQAEFVARQLLRRMGVIFRRAVCASGSRCRGEMSRGPAVPSRRAEKSEAAASWPASTASSTRFPKP